MRKILTLTIALLTSLAVLVGAPQAAQAAPVTTSQCHTAKSYERSERVCVTARYTRQADGDGVAILSVRVHGYGYCDRVQPDSFHFRNLEHPPLVPYVGVYNNSRTKRYGHYYDRKTPVACDTTRKTFKPIFGPDKGRAIISASVKVRFNGRPDKTLGYSFPVCEQGYCKGT